MTKNVIWSPSAEKDLEIILNYLSTHWGNSVVIGFLLELEMQINQIGKNEKLFPLIHKTKKIRRCVLTKHITLICRETKNKLEILRIFDNRQNLKSLRF